MSASEVAPQPPATPPPPVGGRLAGARPYLLLFLPHIVLGAVLCRGITVVHELGHAGMVWLGGGTLVTFATSHANGALGRVEWLRPIDPPLGMSYESFDRIVTLGPTILWAACMAIAALVAVAGRGRLHRQLAAAVFFWLYFIPIYDILWNLLLEDEIADLYRLAGAFVLQVRVAGLALVLGAWIAGYALQRRLLGSSSVGWAGYAFVSFVAWFGVFTGSLVVIPLTQDP